MKNVGFEKNVTFFLSSNLILINFSNFIERKIIYLKKYVQLELIIYLIVFRFHSIEFKFHLCKKNNHF